MITSTLNHDEKSCLNDIQEKLIEVVPMRNLIVQRFKPSIAGGYRAPQRGMATLMVTLILLIVSTLSALAVSRSVFFEQKVTGSDIRNKEVYASAIGGLDYGVEWLRDQVEVWSDLVGGVGTVNATATPDAMASTSQGVDTYDHFITYTLLTEADTEPALIKVTSTATAQNDSQVTKTVEVYVLQSSLLTPSAADGPPLLVENCIPAGANIVGGTPNITTGASGYAIGTVDGTTDCINEGKFDAFDENGNSIPLVKVAATNATGLWGSIFGNLTETDFQIMARDFPAKFVYVDSSYSSTGYYSFNGNTWHEDLGSSTNQVILYFDSSADCPPINGGTVIYGLVYFETEGCTGNGWGGGEIHGTTAIEGDLNKFNSNASLIDLELDNFSGGNTNYNFISMVPGSWRDF